MSTLAVGVSLAATLAACGAGGSSSSSSAGNSGGSAPMNASSESNSASGASEVVVKVDAAPITRAQVNHWMGALAAQDYYELSRRHTEPAGLVSDPPHYGACVQRLEAALAAAASAHKSTPQTGVQLLTRCRQLNQKIRAQAVSFLISLQVVEALATEQKVSASEAEVRKTYQARSAAQFHSKVEQSAVQAARRTSPADELVVYRKNVLASKVLAKLKASGVGLAQVSRTQATLRAKTDCRPGYVVGQCRQFQGEPPNSPANPSASVVTEQLVALITGRCTNIPACGKL